MSRIDPPAPPPPIRKADPSDTRQNIDRQDPDDFHEKKEFEGEGFKDPYQDLTDVSIPALKAFLLNLLPDADTPTAPETHVTTGTVRTSSDARTANAMNAYQSGQNLGQPAPTPTIPKDDKPKTALEQAASKLDPAEIKSLIRELDRLSAQGYKTLSLEKGDNFLASIRDAIANVRRT